MLAVAIAAAHKCLLPRRVPLATSAVFAIFVRIFASFRIAAVATIPVTATVVVTVITNLVIDPCRFPAICCTADAGFNFRRVSAFAIGAQSVLLGLATTITSIPRATANVILVVAVTVSLVFGLLAGGFAIRNQFLVRVPALATFTIAFEFVF